VRGTDVAVRDPEVLAARAEQPLIGEGEDEEEDPGTAKKHKRKARKKDKMNKKRAGKKSWRANEQARALGGEYDEMLLAVVGILEEVKVQGNVAGWMRMGGLMMGQEVLVDSSAKNRRLSDGAEPSDTPPTLSSSSSQPVLVLEDDGSRSDITGITPSAVTGIPMNQSNAEETSIWFEDQELVEWWADKGRVALDGLGIDVVSGVVGSYEG